MRNVADPEAPVVSWAVTVTAEGPAVVGVPEIRPVEGVIDRAAGSPLVVYARVSPLAESLAWTGRLHASLP